MGLFLNHNYGQVVVGDLDINEQELSLSMLLMACIMLSLRDS